MHAKFEFCVHPFGPKGQCCTFSKCHELIQSTREAQTAVRSSLVPHAVLLTHPRTMKCTLVVSQHRQKAVCKSRPGNLLSSAWCFWIVHECAYHVQAKDGFQLLYLNGRFSKIRSHIWTLWSYYCIAEMFGSGKVWRIWRVVRVSPNFNQPNFSL